jgi:hypothetical protein
MTVATWFTLADCWLPILASGVAVFVLSFLMWMVLPHHRSDWRALPDEDGTMDFLGDIPSGQYSFPFCASADSMKDPEWVKKAEGGPAGMLIVRPRGPMNMGKAMAVSFTYNLVISVLVAYVLTISVPDAATGARVLRIGATVAFLGYAGALGWNAIWWNQSWSSTLKSVFDGLVYGLATGALFLWLGPWS